MKVVSKYNGFSLALVLILTAWTCNGFIMEVNWFGNRYQFRASEKVNWMDAWNICRAQGMNLLYLPTKEECDYLAGAFKNVADKSTAYRFWSAGIKSENKKSIWPFLKFPNPYYNWEDNGQGAPSKGCIYFTGKMVLNVADCREEAFLICESKKIQLTAGWLSHK